MPKPVVKALKSIRKDKLKTLKARLKKVTEQIELHPDTLRERLREIRGIPHEELEKELINTGRLTRLKFSCEPQGHEVGDLYSCRIELDNANEVFKGMYVCMPRDHNGWLDDDSNDFIFDDDYVDSEAWTWRRVLAAARGRCAENSYAVAWALASMWAYTQHGRSTF